MIAAASFDVAILGAGFGGSLLSMVLRQQGLSVVLFDRQVHPRFAIGESSTPAADFILERICDEYSLPRIKPLARYGTWRATYPEIARGLKRGFSYFHHTPGRLFETDDDHSNELLVAASAGKEISDTHWYRAEVDQFFAQEAKRLGSILEEGVTVSITPRDDDWRIEAARSDGSASAYHARFFVDASGAGGTLPKLLGIPDRTSELKTASRSVFGHFVGLPPWQEHLTERGIGAGDYPFPCDAAALHQILDGGWMWVLPFENGITSAGFALDLNRHPLQETLSAADEFAMRLKQYPSLEAAFEPARLADSFPAREPLRTGRLQRLWGQAAGANWCLLPSAAGFIDPFYSTGIAQTLCGILRLGAAFQCRDAPREFQSRLADYSEIVIAETRQIDRIVSLAYRSMGGSPELLHIASAIYFAAATTFERRFHSLDHVPGFLLADEPAFRKVVARVESLLTQAADSADRDHLANLSKEVAFEIRHYNAAGLLNPEARKMYRHTAAR